MLNGHTVIVSIKLRCCHVLSMRWYSHSLFLVFASGQWCHTIIEVWSFYWTLSLQIWAAWGHGQPGEGGAVQEDHEAGSARVAWPVPRGLHGAAKLPLPLTPRDLLSQGDARLWTGRQSPAERENYPQGILDKGLAAHQAADGLEQTLTQPLHGEPQPVPALVQLPALLRHPGDPHQALRPADHCHG